MTSASDFNILSSLFEKFHGQRPDTVTPLPGSGSDRRYFRLKSESDGYSCIGVTGNNHRENETFIKLARAFRSHGVNVPEIYGEDKNFSAYIQQDLGPVSLFDIISRESHTELVAECMRKLAELQALDRSVWESLVMEKPFSARQVHWDLNYFKYEFLLPSAVVFDADALEDDFDRFASKIMRLADDESLRGFMYRDCQSRNVMVYEGTPYWIDFQGGRLGPVIYDAVSFLWQARAGFSPDFRDNMLRTYASFLSKIKDIDPDAILSAVDDFALFRTLQVLGAYGFRGLVQKRAHFIQSIPQALQNLRELIDKGTVDNYPELARVMKAVIDSERFKTDSHSGLTLKVFSFSYKKGYPEDYTGNGGGFMFDCRSMHNPGRYPEYRNLTGQDSAVIEFLEKRGEVQQFVSHAESVVMPAVERYLKRGFTDLQVGFGCTGGQHRSVYCAETLARDLADRFPEVTVELIHREQGICSIVENKIKQQAD